MKLFGDNQHRRELHARDGKAHSGTVEYSSSTVDRESRCPSCKFFKQGWTFAWHHGARLCRELGRSFRLIAWLFRSKCHSFGASLIETLNRLWVRYVAKVHLRVTIDLSG